MLTVSARKHIVNTIRTELRVSLAAANAIVDRDGNGFHLSRASLPLNGLVAMVADAYARWPRLLFDRLSDEGYAYVGSLVLTADDLAAWNQLPLEETYATAVAISENMAPVRDSQGRILETVEAHLVDCSMRKNHIKVSVVVDGRHRILVKVPDINTLEGTYRYVREQLGTVRTLYCGTMGANDLGIDPTAAFVDMIMPADTPLAA